jgi:hypothetical protein
MMSDAAKELYLKLNETACVSGMDTVVEALRLFLEETTTRGIEKVRNMAAIVRSRDGEESHG